MRSKCSFVVISARLRCFRFDSGLPNGQVPVLEVDGVAIPQSLAIMRYAAKLGGKLPKEKLAIRCVRMCVFSLV